MKKPELEVALDEYLSKNASQFSADQRLTPFYKKRAEGSPIKKETPSILSDGETKVKQVRRRVTKAAEEITNVLSGATT